MNYCAEYVTQSLGRVNQMMAYHHKYKPFTCESGVEVIRMR